jgi:hypothetical protein
LGCPDLVKTEQICWLGYTVRNSTTTHGSNMHLFQIPYSPDE